jgi:DNA-binding transcriptional LysR family regulator
MISLKQLQVFIAVAQYQNVSRAAEQLCLTQSATSVSLSQLEKNLNFLLFDRKGKKLVINQQGHQILPKAKNILENLFELENMLQSTELTGTLIIGASSTVGNYLLPKPLSHEYVTPIYDYKLATQALNKSKDTLVKSKPKDILPALATKEIFSNLEFEVGV